MTRERTMLLTFCLCASLLTLLSISSAVTDNPADRLVDALNKNRSLDGLSSLFGNPGLGCIALQYLKSYEGKCDKDQNARKPTNAEFAETFAPNCGIQVSSLANITGRLLGCQSDYVHSSEAFSRVLIRNKASLDLLESKNHTQVGAAVSGTEGGSPYFWCVLFASGARNSTFTAVGSSLKVQHPGCFSGTNDDCSASASDGKWFLLWAIFGILFHVARNL